MASNLGFAVLGLLARAPLTGYELARRMERPVGYFWTAGHSQIYPELARLERDGLVVHEVVAGAGPRETKRYTVTEAGFSALARWVAAPMEPQPQRDLETLRLWSVWAVPPDARQALVRQMAQAHRERLEDYRRQLAEVEASPDSRDPNHPLYSSRLTLAGGVRVRQAAVEWCDWLAAELGADDVSADSGGGGVHP